jgi:hypothetical protein
MRLGEFDVMIVNSADRDGLSAEIQKGNLGLGAVYLDKGIPIIEIGPNRKNEYGVWTIDYRTFKQIVKALDDFLISINYVDELQEE